jgi:hypothetical protein
LIDIDGESGGTARMLAFKDTMSRRKVGVAELATRQLARRGRIS